MRMSIFLKLSIVLSLTTVALAKKRDDCDCDIAIIGGGAAGASAAVFLKDKGYDVCLFERRSRLGGNCGTYQIPANEVPLNCPTCPNWLETGVKFYENSTFLNQAGIGKWNLATDRFIRRFVPRSAVRAVDFNSFPVNFTGVYDYQSQIGPIVGTTQSAPDDAFLAAYGRLLGILFRYNWIDQIDGVPRTIPTELLLPFSTLIQNYNLYPLVNPVFGPLIVAQGILDWDTTPALYALYNMKRSLLELINPSRSGLSIDGGCSRLFDGIQRYLGDDSVFLNANVTSVVRPNGNRNNGVIRLTATVNGGAPRTWKVDALVIAIPPKSSSMTFLDSDDTERALFAKVRTRVYWPSLVKVQGAVESQNFALFAFQFTNPPYYTPLSPSIVLYTKDYTYGPAKSYVVYTGETEPTREEAINFVNSQLARTPVAMSTNATTDNVFRHQYEPYFPNQFLGETPNPFVQFRRQQGAKNTFYVGGLLAAPGSSAGIFEHAYNLVNQYF